MGDHVAPGETDTQRRTRGEAEGCGNR